MSMTDIISGDRFFATYLALLSHFTTPLQCSSKGGDIQRPFTYGKYFVYEYLKVC